MRTIRFAIIASFVVLLCAAANVRPADHAPSVARASLTRPPCSFPTAPAATAEETAWEFFVAVNCPVSPSRLVWETWVEQFDFYTTPPNTTEPRRVHRRLHPSVLAALAHQSPGSGPSELSANTECGEMARQPTNLVPQALVCEEVRLNGAAAAYLREHGYEYRAGQAAAARAGAVIQFPPDAIEMKVDWIPATDFWQPFSCTSPPHGLRVELIDGQCYALVGMHIASKLLHDWLWATFEPQSMATNPNRCITFGACHDPWGSRPSTSSGGSTGFTRQTPALASLMKSAALEPAFANYRLDGVQTTFITPGGAPTELGNSIIEGETPGMTHDASCISCHSTSSIETDGTDYLAKLLKQLPGGPIGRKFSAPPGWMARDFAWSMAVAQPR